MTISILDILTWVVHLRHLSQNFLQRHNLIYSLVQNCIPVDKFQRCGVGLRLCLDGCLWFLAPAVVAAVFMLLVVEDDQLVEDDHAGAVYHCARQLSRLPGEEQRHR